MSELKDLHGCEIKQIRYPNGTIFGPVVRPEGIKIYLSCEERADWAVVVDTVSNMEKFRVNVIYLEQIEW